MAADLFETVATPLFLAFMFYWVFHDSNVSPGLVAVSATLALGACNLAFYVRDEYREMRESK